MNNRSNTAVIPKTPKCNTTMKKPTIVFVYDRHGRADKTHKGTIELRITLNRKQKFMSTGISVYPYQWKGGNPYVSGYPTSGEDNRSLAAIMQKASKIVSGMMESGGVDIDAIPTLMKRQKENMTFLQYLLRRIEQRQVVDYTRRSYVTFFNKLAEYGKIKFFSDITERNIRDFDEWLHAYRWQEGDANGRSRTKQYTQATIYSFHKNLKNFIADANVDGFLSENIYVAKRIKIDKGEARIDKYLTLEELEQIREAKMPTRALAETRDLFLFACETGLSFADLMEFDPKKITEVDGVRLYSGKRHKTGIEFTCVITDTAMAIIEQYANKLPKTSNQKYNMRLKIVADAAGIEKPISSHYARHTAGMVWLNSGVPIEVVSRCLGHSNLQMTQKAYAKILDKTIVRAFKHKGEQ